MDPALLRRTAEIAAEYLSSLPERPVRADASLEELRSALRVGLDEAPRPALEEIAGEWLLDLLGLPADSGVGLATGCQMAHFTCLAAARHRVLADAGWDVEADGLFGAPPIRVLVGAVAEADSWATDAHKWLNVPYDCGVAVVRDRAAHVAAMNSFAGA